MSSEIYYDRAYIRVENRFIPLVNHGSNNCFEVGPSGREIPERYWEVLNYSDRHKFLFTDAEMLRVANEYEEINSHNRGGIRRSRNREFPAGGFGRWILRGMRYAHTVEEYTQYGNALLVIDGVEHCRYHVKSTAELLETLEKLKDSENVSITFANHRSINKPPVSSGKSHASRAKKGEENGK